MLNAVVRDCRHGQHHYRKRSNLPACGLPEGGGLTVFSVAANGRLTVQESFGFTGRLQVDLPSVLQKAGIRTDRFAVIGYYATASLIVLACQKAEI